MAAASKIDRLRNGPGLFEITFAALISLVLGVTLACFHLIFKPVEQVREVPKQVVPGQVYFREGSNDATKSRQWARKRQMLIDGGSAEVALTEDELNAWLTTAASGAKTEGKETASFSFEPRSLNVRMEQAVLQLGVPGDVDLLGQRFPLIIHAKGRLEAGSSGYVFAADELFIGSLPTHRVPGLKEYLMARIVAAQAVPEEVSTAWKRITRVVVDNGVLRLSLP